MGKKRRRDGHERHHRALRPAPKPTASTRLPLPPNARRIGAALLALLAVLGTAGYVLAFQYAPDPARAHDAVASIAKGRLRTLRGLHAWAATAVLLLALLHPARAWIRSAAADRGPRRWFTGSAALSVLVGAYFTGTVLPWDQQGWEALQHLRAGASGVGVDVADAEDPGRAPLRLLFLAHILAVPLVLAGLLAMHLHRGLAPRAWTARIARLVASDRRGLLAAGALLLALAIAAPPELGPAPVRGIAVTAPDWPFLWLVPLQDAFGPAGLWALPLALAALAAVPVARRHASDRERWALLACAAAALLGLSVAGTLH